MPKFLIHWVDVAAHLQASIQPIFLLERPLLHGDKPHGGVFNVAEVARAGSFLVVTSGVFDDKVEMSLTESGQYVRIPIFAYKTADRALPVIFGTGMQIGLSAYHALRQYSRDDMQAVVMVLGHTCTDTPDGIRCYVGMAFQMK